VGWQIPLMLAVADGKLNPAQGFMQGKAKVKGDLSEALELVAVRIFERYAPGVPKNPMIGLAKECL
jgi:SCP-2 sterol transfer family protein